MASGGMPGLATAAGTSTEGKRKKTLPPHWTSPMPAVNLSGKYA
jgi:hypothetical protein